MAPTRNVMIWIGTAAIAFGLWFFAARTRLHLIDPLTFIGYVAVAALGLTALLWWGLAAQDPGENAPDLEKEKD